MDTQISLKKNKCRKSAFSDNIISTFCFCITLTLILLSFSLLFLIPRANAELLEVSVIKLTSQTEKGSTSNEIGVIEETDSEEIEQNAVVAGYIEPIPYVESNGYYDISLTDSQQNTVFAYCSYYDVPNELVLAIMKVESNFNSDDISGTNDFGIMQINAVNHEWLRDELGITDFLDFAQNVHCGTFLLSEYYHKYAEVNKIAMCYKYGESGAISMWEQGIYETEYTKAVVCAIASLTKR